MAVVVVVVVIVIGIKPKAYKATVEPIAVKPVSMKSASVKPASVKPAKSTVKSATVEPATAVETCATAMRVGDVWLAERRGAQQSGCDYQSPSDPALGSMLA